jgi:hypothetical protein
MKKVLTTIAATLFVQFPAVAGDFYDNPWKLKSPVRLKPVESAQLYKHVVFTGWPDDLEAYVNHHNLKVKVFSDYWVMGNSHITGWETVGNGRLWGICNHGRTGPYHEIVCVAVDKKGRPLDSTIFQVK